MWMASEPHPPTGPAARMGRALALGGLFALAACARSEPAEAVVSLHVEGFLKRAGIT